MSRDYSPVTFVSTPDLLEFVERGVLLPQPIDIANIDRIFASQNTQDLASTAAPDTRSLRIAHAPTNRTLKGSDFLLAAVDKLKDEGLPIELVLIEGLSHEAAKKLMLTCDIIADQFLTGSYGMVTAEALAIGKQALVYIRPDLIEKYPEIPPVINASPHDLEKCLRDLVEQRGTISAGRDDRMKYARKWHSPGSFAKRTLAYY